jgi:membrane protein DedA with SNARE-associated domain
VEAYIQDLLDLISRHAGWAGPIMFIALFCESIAFLSLLFPGTAILLAAGALIPSGIIPLWPVLLWSIVGATLGGSVSYEVGKRYGWVLARLWPFTRHPDLLPRSLAFFTRYDGKSVFIGRFFGPLRAVMPLAAGLLRMPPGRFWVASVSSALVWAPCMLFSGALLGFATETTATGQFSLPIVLAVFGICSVVGVWIIKRLAQRRGQATCAGPIVSPPVLTE